MRPVHVPTPTKGPARALAARRQGTSPAESGLAVLVTVLLLSLLSALALAALHAQAWSEQRASTLDAQARQAFEAAEAGLDWALARLNDPASIDGHCRPLAGGDGRSSFRATHVLSDDSTDSAKSYPTL